MGLHASPPLLSFGLPVRNGAATIAEAIESLQGQTLPDWELVISDNMSVDGTDEICRRYAASDDRIRYVPTGRDLAQNENFCEAFRQSRGTFFRWYGDDDWLEPNYATTAVGALRASPEAVLCTTVQQYYRDGQRQPPNDPIPVLGGVVSADPATRVCELLRLFEHGGHLGIDPVYSLVRRDIAARTRLLAPMRYGDFTYSCEIAMLGPFVHVPELLGHRRLAGAARQAIPPMGRAGQRAWSPYIQRERSIMHVLRAARPLSPRARMRLAGGLFGFAAREHAHGLRRRARRLQVR